MKRSIIMLVNIVSVVIFSSPAVGADLPKILLLLPDPKPNTLSIYSRQEANVMKSMLEKAGFKIVAVTADGMPIKGSTETLMPDLKLSEVRIDEYVGVIIPCFGRCGALPSTSVSPIAVSITKQAVTQGKPVAVSDASVIILVEAGVLVGKRYGYSVDPLGIGRRPDDRFNGTIYVGTGVVQDGNIITCGACPRVSAAWGYTVCTAELTQALITALTPKK